MSIGDTVNYGLNVERSLSPEAAGYKVEYGKFYPDNTGTITYLQNETFSFTLICSLMHQKDIID